MKALVTSFSEYLKHRPKDQQQHVKNMRSIVKKAAPKAIEKIAYGMPAYDFMGPLMYFAGMKGHLGFYPTPSGIKAFAKELKPYSSSKGCVRFPYDQPLPKQLITAIVKFRVKENSTKAKAKK